MLKDTLTAAGIDFAERGWLPEALVRRGMRKLCAERLRATEGKSSANLESLDEAFAAECRRSEVAPLPEKANQQHYEVPAALYELILGPRRKYSSCYFPELDESASAASEPTSLAAAEEHALRITCERAEIENGMTILELGCGWGSLTRYLAERFPQSAITAVSNSTSQREFIESQARRRGYADRLRVITADMNEFVPAGKFDRVVSVEMFEHMRNYERLLARIADCLEPAGKLFVHIFCHRDLSYPFESEGAANWMGRYFFSGGIMPSAKLLRRFPRDLTVTREWQWNGRHYARTAEEWLHNMQIHRGEIMPLLSEIYSPREAVRWYHRWRMLFLAGAELFGYRGGDEWFVSHYLFEHAKQHRASHDNATVRVPAQISS